MNNKTRTLLGAGAILAVGVLSTVGSPSKAAANQTPMSSLVVTQQTANNNSENAGFRYFHQEIILKKIIIKF